MASKKIDVSVLYKDDVLKDLISTSLADRAEEINLNFLPFDEKGSEILKNTKCEFLILQCAEFSENKNQFLDLICSVANKIYIVCISDSANNITESELIDAGAKEVVPITLLVPKVVELIFKNYQKEVELKSALHFSAKSKGHDFITREIFLMGISHEIRTPLNSIIGFTNF